MITKIKRKIYVILTTVFIKQNNYHKYGVLFHTIKVVYYVFQRRMYRMIPAAFFHDISKPFVAYQKPEDILENEYSFTDHADQSYEIIKNLKGISKYTKNLVLYHYLIRDIEKSFEKDKIRYLKKREEWDKLNDHFQQDLKIFLICDDAAK